MELTIYENKILINKKIINIREEGISKHKLSYTTLLNIRNCFEMLCIDAPVKIKNNQYGIEYISFDVKYECIFKKIINVYMFAKNRVIKYHLKTEVSNNFYFIFHMLNMIQELGYTLSDLGNELNEFINICDIISCKYKCRYKLKNQLNTKTVPAYHLIFKSDFVHIFKILYTVCFRPASNQRTICYINNYFKKLNYIIQNQHKYTLSNAYHTSRDEVKNMYELIDMLIDSFSYITLDEEVQNAIFKNILIMKLKYNIF